MPRSEYERGYTAGCRGGGARTEEQGRRCTKNRLGGIRILVRTQLRAPLYSGEPNAGAHAHGDSSAADPTSVVAVPTAAPL